MKIYYTQIQEFKDTDFAGILPMEIDERGRSYKSESAKLAYYAARFLEQHVFGEEVFGLKAHSKNGKPCAINDVHYCISHHGDYCILTVGSFEHGCDIIKPFSCEDVSRLKNLISNRLRIAKRYFSKEEAESLMSCANALTSENALSPSDFSAFEAQFCASWAWRESIIKSCDALYDYPTRDYNGEGLGEKYIYIAKQCVVFRILFLEQHIVSIAVPFDISNFHNEDEHISYRNKMSESLDKIDVESVSLNSPVSV